MGRKKIIIPTQEEIDKVVEEKMQEYKKQHTVWIHLKYGQTFIGYDVYDNETKILMSSLLKLIELMEINYMISYPIGNDKSFYISIDGEDKARAEFFQKFFDNGYKLTWY